MDLLNSIILTSFARLLPASHLIYFPPNQYIQNMANELNIQDILKGIDELRKSQAETKADFDARLKELHNSQAESKADFDARMKELRESPGYNNGCSN